MDSKPQLFLFHFAGGSCYSFKPLLPYLDCFEVISLELPGRGKRMQEPLIKDFDAAVNDLFRQVREKITTTDIIIYGHSMGAYLAAAVTAMLEEQRIYPSLLCVSGTPGPGIAPNKRRYQMKTDEFIAELRRLGGVSEEFLTNMDLFSFYEPILRSDFEVSEGGNGENLTPVMAPLCAVMGDKEEYVKHITNWSRFTKSFFSHQSLEGDHFFIFNCPVETALFIKRCYENVTSPHYK
jgi:surfactin synthase thioesterase subunit